MVSALASHQCGPGSIPGPSVICGLNLLLVPVLAPGFFYRVFRLHHPPPPLPPPPPPTSTKSTLLNSNSIREQWMKSHCKFSLLRSSCLGSSRNALSPTNGCLNQNHIPFNNLANHSFAHIFLSQSRQNSPTKPIKRCVLS